MSDFTPFVVYHLDCPNCAGKGQIQCERFDDGRIFSYAAKLEKAFDTAMSHRTRVLTNGPHLPDVRDHFDPTMQEPSFGDSMVYSSLQQFEEALEATATQAANARKRILEKMEPGWFEASSYLGLWNPAPKSHQRRMNEICTHKGVRFEYLVFMHEGKQVFRLAWTFQGQYKLVGATVIARMT